jgi:hypothetical protein
MKLRSLLTIAGLSWLTMAEPQAATSISYQGVISHDVPVTGLIGGFGYIDQDAPNVNFWSFSGLAGQHVTIRATRLDPDLDPIMDLYFGTTTAKESAFAPQSNWGGMTYVTHGDDEASVAGPFGDPLIYNLVLPATGSYTIAVGGGGSHALPDDLLPYTLVVYPSSGVFGDANDDGVVDCRDLTAARSAIGKTTGQTGFLPAADIDGNGVIDVRDIAAIARLLPPGTNCN